MPRLSSLTAADSEQSKNHRDYEVGTTEERTLVSVARWGKGLVPDRPRGEEGCPEAGAGLWRPGGRNLAARGLGHPSSSSTLAWRGSDKLGQRTVHWLCLENRVVPRHSPGQ